MFQITAAYTTHIRSLKSKDHFIEKAQTDLLKETIAKPLQIEKLLKLHEDLNEELQHLTYKYALIGNMFERYSEKFLIYCEVLPKIPFVTKLLEEKMSFNIKFREDIQRLEKAFNEKYKNNDELLGKSLII